MGLQFGQYNYIHVLSNEVEYNINSVNNCVEKESTCAQKQKSRNCDKQPNIGETCMLTRSK